MGETNYPLGVLVDIRLIIKEPDRALVQFERTQERYWVSPKAFTVPGTYEQLEANEQEVHEVSLNQPYLGSLHILVRQVQKLFPEEPFSEDEGTLEEEATFTEDAGD